MKFKKTPPKVHWHESVCSGQKTENRQQVTCKKCLKKSVYNDVSLHETHSYLYPEQAAGCELIFDRINSGEKFSVLSGEGGTGKTTILKAIVDCCNRAARKVMLLATTGKAALVLSQKTKTSHSQMHLAYISLLINSSKMLTVRQ